MPVSPQPSIRKRAVKLTLSESLVKRVRGHTDNLSAIVEELLTAYVAGQEQERESRQEMANACAADWNAVYDRIGSFADEHPTL